MTPEEQARGVVDEWCRDWVGNPDGIPEHYSELIEVVAQALRDERNTVVDELIELTQGDTDEAKFYRNMLLTFKSTQPEQAEES